MNGQDQTPATGSAAAMAWAIQTEGTIPNHDDLRFVLANLPLNVGLVRQSLEDGAVNPLGWALPKVPGDISSSPELNFRLTSPDFLEPAYNLARHVTKESLQGGVAFSYEFFPDRFGPDLGMTVYVSTPPVENRFVHSVKVVQIEIPLDTPKALVAKVTGVASAGQSYGVRVPAIGNSGSYNDVRVRGPVKYKGLGDLYIRIADASSSPITYRAEITDDGEPVFPGTPVGVFIDPLEERGDWHALQGTVKIPGAVTVAAGQGANSGEFVGVGCRFRKFLQPGNLIHTNGETGTILSIEDDDNLTLRVPHSAGANGVKVLVLNRDLGHKDTNQDPLEGVFQGTQADHENAAANDQWSFPSKIATITPVYEPNHGVFTSAHVKLSFREFGTTGPFIPLRGTAAKLTLMYPVDEERGTGSRYANAQDKIGLASASMAFTSVFRKRNLMFVDWAEAHEFFELRITIESGQLGDGTIHNGHVFTLPYGSLTETHVVSDPGRVEIETGQSFTTDELGAFPPWTWNTITPRDWDIPGEPLAPISLAPTSLAQSTLVPNSINGLVTRTWLGPMFDSRRQPQRRQPR